MYSDITFIKAENTPDDPLYGLINSLAFIPNSFGHQLKDPRACCKDRVIGDFELIYVIGGESHITVEDQPYICRIFVFRRNSLAFSKNCYLSEGMFYRIAE